jgi:hypothetical protein
MIMTASRNRRILIVGVLAALFALGGGCLAYLTIASSEGSAAGSDAAAGAGQPSPLTSSDGSSPGDAGAPGAGSSGGGGGGDGGAPPPKPRHNPPTTGIDLDGNGDTTCFTVIFTDRVRMPLRVNGVGVTSTNGVIVANPRRCSDCVGTRLGPDDSKSCQVGVRLSGRKPYPADVRVTVTLTMDATCTDSSRKPCDDPKVAALSPSEANPIALKVTGTLIRTIPVSGAESPGPPPDEGQSTPDPGEEPSTPDTQSVPEPAPSEVSS